MATQPSGFLTSLSLVSATSQPTWWWATVGPWNPAAVPKACLAADTALGSSSCLTEWCPLL